MKAFGIKDKLKESNNKVDTDEKFEEKIEVVETFQNSKFNLDTIK